MKKKVSFISVASSVCCIVFASCSGGSGNSLFDKAVSEKGRCEMLFDAGWRFFRGGIDKAEAVRFDDSSWRLLDLPHDWSIEDLPGKNSPFDSTAIGGIDAGYLVGGSGFYRKSFFLPHKLNGKHFLLQFDGVYMNATVWMNGKFLGSHPYGYTGFSFDITDELLPGKKNTIAVKVSNEGRNSRWYSGSGIYRHVWLTIIDPIHLDPLHIAITTPVADPSHSTVLIKAGVFNELSARAEFALQTRIIDNSGREAGRAETRQNVEAGGDADVAEEIGISNPSLWSIDTPVLYTAVNEVYIFKPDGTRVLRDRIETKFGIRSVVINPRDGFLLNGQHILLKGGCMHHDNGPLGSAAFDRAEERRVELMKASGFNAIRCAHNPPSPAFLDACDRLGMLIIDEAFDMWRQPKNQDDYHLYFDDWCQSDIESMVLRDRNHPSVILWSIGNEIPERGKPESVETARKLAGYITDLDSTRLITSAVNNVKKDMDPFFSVLGVCGYNYARDSYKKDHERLPARIMVATESFPLEAYDYWMAVKDLSWVIGDFVWTGFDYLGEASIGWLGYPHEGSFFPWNHAYCGDIDICGFKRPQSYYRDAIWGNGKSVSIFVKPPIPSFPLNPKEEKWDKWNWNDVVQSWNWQGYEGKELEVEVYSSCQEVELFLNQKSLGRQKTDRDTKWIARWKVQYSPGVLSARGYEGSSEAASCDLKTAGKPVKIKLTADRSSLKADGEDLSYITIELLDENNVRNPVAENPVNFEIEGPGSILAVGSSNPRSLESFKQPHRKAYQGRCLVIVKSGKTQGNITIKASSDGIEPSKVTINSL